MTSAGFDGARPGATVDLASVMDRRWSGLQVLVLFLTGFAIVLDGFDNQALAFVLPALLQEWDLPRSAFAPVLSVSLIGMTVGAAGAGYLGDRFGRKPALIGCVLLFGLLTAAAGLCENIGQLTLLRFLAGLGLGGAMPNAAALIAEFTPVRSRTLAVSFTAVCVPLGGVFGGALTAAILPALGWRSLFLLAGIAPVALALLLAVWLPESPRFLLRRGDPNKRLPALMRRMGAEVTEATVFDDRAEPMVPSGGERERLLSPANRRNTLAMCVAFFFTLLGAYAGMNWLPTLIAQAGYSLANASLALMVFNIGGVTGAIVGGWAAGVFGSRRTLYALLAVGFAASLVLARFGFSPADGTLALFCLLAVLGFAVPGAQSVLTAVAAQVFPTELRSTGVGLSIGVGRAGGITSAFVGASFLAWSGRGAFFLMIALAIIGAALALAVVNRHTPARAKAA